MTAVLLGPAHAAGPEQPAASISPTIGLERGRLTVESRDADLADLLRQIAARAGFRLDTVGALGRVSMAFTSVPLDEGIRRLTRDHELMLVYGSQGPADLVEVRVYARAPTRSTRPASAATRAASLAEIGRLVRAPDVAGSIDRLASLLASAADPTVRARAAWALGRIGGAAVGPALTHAVSDPTPDVRIQAAYALRRVDGAAAVPALAGLLLSDPEARVRRAAASSLGALREAAAASALSAAAQDPDPSVRQAVNRALRRYGVTPR